jgi:hypothetical protein
VTTRARPRLADAAGGDWPAQARALAAESRVREALVAAGARRGGGG